MIINQPCGVTDNEGLTKLIMDAENGPLDRPRNRSVYSEQVLPLLWEQGPCCDAHEYKPEVLKACPDCGAMPDECEAKCRSCGACMHCGSFPLPPVLGGARHLCVWKMMHNGYEWRTQWIVRVKEGTEGAEEMGPGIWTIRIWLDFDLRLWDKVTWSVEKEQERRRLLTSDDVSPQELADIIAGKLSI